MSFHRDGISIWRVLASEPSSDGPFQPKRPDLSIGVYVLQSDRQSPEHDRHIPDEVRREVLRRDNYMCKTCRWSHGEWNPSDPRHLELHHKKSHVSGGENVEGNLKTLCTVCHDKVHRSGKEE
jgi:hypothetical protein